MIDAAFVAFAMPSLDDLHFGLSYASLRSLLFSLLLRYTLHSLSLLPLH